MYKWVCVLKQDTSDDLSANFEYKIKDNQFRLKKKLYTIDGILPQSTQQSDVYEHVAVNQIESFLKGFNVTIFAYGQTGSGKTHTIFGPNINLNISSNLFNQHLYGLVPRCFITIFEALQDAKHINKHQIDISCVEVYNVKFFLSLYHIIIKYKI